MDIISSLGENQSTLILFVCLLLTKESLSVPTMCLTGLVHHSANWKHTFLSLCLLFLMYTWRGSAICRIRPSQYIIEKNYSVPGHLTLGIVMTLHPYQSNVLCSSSVHPLKFLQRMEAIVFAIEEINRNASLLPNVKLGFIIFDDCDNYNVTTSTVLHFIQDGSACAQSSDTDVFDRMDAVAVIGPEASSAAMRIVDVLSLFRIPQISYKASSPLLDKYEYFLRTIPSDVMQSEVIVDILVQFRWSYVSIVYIDNDYGRQLYYVISKKISEIGFCVATYKKLQRDFNEVDGQKIVQRLTVKSTGRVVILLMGPTHATKLFQSVAKWKWNGNFTWIGSEAFQIGPDAPEDVKQIASGMLSIRPMQKPVKRFEEYFQSLTLHNGSRNPWFKEFYAKEFGCDPDVPSNAPGACDMDTPIGNSKTYMIEESTSLPIDAVYALAHALHAVLKNCPQPTSPRQCVESSELREALLKVNFSGEHFQISFDESGNGRAGYYVSNVYLQEGQLIETVVGEWSTETLQFKYFYKEKVKWYNDPTRTNTDTSKIPTSQCSLPCRRGYEMRMTSSKCCWDCIACGANERTVKIFQPSYKVNHTIELAFMNICSVCPSNNFTWPDDATRTQCLPIPVSSNDITQVNGALLFAFMILIFTSACVSGVLYFVNHNDRLIKASSRELSFLMIVGHMITCIIAINFTLEPSIYTCSMAMIGFHLSFTVTYAPLLLKTVRIYRIFVQHVYSLEKLVCIGPIQQIILASVIIVCEILIFFLGMIHDLPEGVTQMPDRKVKYVEQVCTLPVGTSVASLVFNFLLIGACAATAVTIRNVPAYFNEAKFIGVAIYSIGLLIVAFILVYVTSTTDLMKRVWVVVFMLMNMLMSHALLLYPKLFAIYCLSSQAITGPPKTKNTTLKQFRKCGGGRLKLSSMTNSSIRPATIETK